MEMTKKLYDMNAYATEFDAKVLACEKVDGKQQTAYQVVLDQTLFFPEEGGQSPDKGVIQEIEVLDVQTKQGIITHTLTAPLEVGATVHGVIDWNHRFNNMQQHSGEHIFSGLVHAKYGYDNVGFHLSNQIVTMDFNGVLSAKEVKEIELEANRAIVKNLSIEVSFPSKEELADLDYRSKIEIDGQVRIVTIPGVDVCACCAPHVSRTGEIGMLKIQSLQSYKGGVRISILCGFRALEDYCNRVAINQELSALLSTNQGELPEAVNKLKNQNQSLKAQLAAAKQECMEEKLKAIPADQENVILFEKNLDAQVMRSTVNQLVEQHAGVCGIFAGDDVEGYHFILGSSGQDVRQIMNGLKENLQAKGGGSAAMVQGSVTAKREEIIKMLQ